MYIGGFHRLYAKYYGVYIWDLSIHYFVIQVSLETTPLKVLRDH